MLNKDKLPKILSTVGVICLIIAVVVVYGWYQNHEIEEVEVKKMVYTVSEDTVVQQNASAVKIVDLTVDDLKNYRDIAKERVQFITDLQNEYIIYWRGIDNAGNYLSTDYIVDNMIRLNADLNKYFPKQDLDISWCDVGILYGDVEWKGYVLRGGDDKVPCMWLCHLKKTKQLVAYAYGEYDNTTDTFVNGFRKETLIGGSMSESTDDSKLLRSYAPVEADKNIIPEYSMSDYKFVNGFSDILKDAGVLPRNYVYHNGDTDMSEHMTFPEFDENGIPIVTEEGAQ